MRNIVHPGWVTSQYDGDRHFIGFGALCRLYGLDPNKAIMAKDYMSYRPDDRHFRPRPDGNYKRVD